MTATQLPPLADLYETDETAWLEAMARLAARGDGANLDYPHLAEYLSDMAKRDKREVRSRLTILIAHLLKWQYQPAKRSTNWRLTVVTQRLELGQMLESRTLANHAGDVLASAYEKAVDLASVETSLPITAFPAACPYTLDEVMEGIALEELTNGPSDA